MASKIQEFLAKAHQATYASGEKAKQNINGADQFNFLDGDYEYIDTYYGSDNFVGTEIVKEKGISVWGMSYYGYFMSDKVTGEETFKFLQQMLFKTKPGMLLRGPQSFKQKEWSYRYSYKGSFSNFTAHEVVKYKGRKVHQARFNGGLIKN